MWDAEDGGGSACYAMGRKAVIVNELAGYRFNRGSDDWIIAVLRQSHDYG